MKKGIELRVKLGNAADAYSKLGNEKLANLLDEAGNALEDALGILDRFEDPEAKEFVKKHSVPLSKRQARVISRIGFMPHVDGKFVLPIEDFAEYVGVSLSSVRKAIKEGRIVAKKHCASSFIDVERYSH